MAFLLLAWEAERGWLFVWGQPRVHSELEARLWEWENQKSAQQRDTTHVPSIRKKVEECVGQEDLLLFQRTEMGFPAPTVAQNCNASSMAWHHLLAFPDTAYKFVQTCGGKTAVHVIETLSYTNT